jgi:hypothetical protein
MAVKFTVVHRADPNNVGDIASNPLQYFLKPDEYQVVDIIKLDKTVYNSNLPLIVGGGGLIANEFMGNFLDRVFDMSDMQQLVRMNTDRWQLSNLEFESTYNEFNLKFSSLIQETISKIPTVTAPRFIWGAGHNSDGEIDFEKIKWPREFARFKHIGIRDYDKTSPFQWVPCASCMHPALDKKYAIKNDIIFFEHKKQLIKSTEFGSESIPRFINSGSNIEQTIELLGSSNIILTNSYHGAYWGTLLKKKVIIVGGAWSSKFKFFKHQPQIVGKKDSWRDSIDRATVFENSIDECRKATINYWNTIKNCQ